MTFKIILKTKNEDDLIDIWIRYYSKMVGKENLIIFDNNSTSQKVLDAYKEHGIEIKKIDVPNNVHHYHLNVDFYENIFSGCDWFAVLDTDEFLCVYKDGKFSTDGVLDVLGNTSHKVLGSTWLRQIHSGESVEYFKINKSNHNRDYGKAIFNTSYQEIRDYKNVIYGHNIFCKDACLDSNLFLLHLDRTNPEIRIKNCLEMCLISSSHQCKDVEKNELRKKVNKELQLIKATKIPSNEFLYMTFSDDFMSSTHKLKELQLYYSDKDTYLKKYYGFENEYIRTNIINHYVYGEEYIQEIKTSNEV